MIKVGLSARVTKFNLSSGGMIDMMAERISNLEWCAPGLWMEKEHTVSIYI